VADLQQPSPDRTDDLSKVATDLKTLTGKAYDSQAVEKRLIIIDGLLERRPGFESAITEVASLVGVANGSGCAGNHDAFAIFDLVLNSKNCPVDVAQRIDAAVRALTESSDKPYLHMDVQDILLLVPRTAEVQEFRILQGLRSEDRHDQTAAAAAAWGRAEDIFRSSGENLRQRVIDFLRPIAPDLLRIIADVANDRDLLGLVLPCSRGQSAIFCFSTFAKDRPDFVLDLLGLVFEPARSMTMYRAVWPLAEQDRRVSDIGERQPRSPVFNEQGCTLEAQGSLILITQVLGKSFPSTIMNAVKSRITNVVDPFVTETSDLMVLAAQMLARHNAG
jgi:hypothetical protein